MAFGISERQHHAGENLERERFCGKRDNGILVSFLPYEHFFSCRTLAGISRANRIRARRIRTSRTGWDGVQGFGSWPAFPNIRPPLLSSHNPGPPGGFRLRIRIVIISETKAGGWGDFRPGGLGAPQTGAGPGKFPAPQTAFSQIDDCGTTGTRVLQGPVSKIEPFVARPPPHGAGGKIRGIWPAADMSCPGAFFPRREGQKGSKPKEKAEARGYFFSICGGGPSFWGFTGKCRGGSFSGRWGNIEKKLGPPPTGGFRGPVFSARGGQGFLVVRRGK